ncbi:MAG: RnfABCDGE type electron transport complex subunit D [Desulfamplus sp.]|nr:RnfABCDGE type electron transport complex subunit D [Desulfamplus sp.]
MFKQNKFTVSHAPFWHDGDSIKEMNLNIMAAALPATLFGIIQFGMAALGVVCLSIASAMAWEALFCVAAKRPIVIHDYNAAVIGMLFGMMLPATIPWWAVITGTFVCIVIGQQVFGGIGGNPFNPTLIGMAITSLSWQHLFDFNTALVNYQLAFTALDPLAALKHQGASVVAMFPTSSLLMGKQVGAIGSIFAAGLIAGGIYLIIRGYIRWEITLSYIVGIIVTAWIFNITDPVKYAAPMFHLLTGYTLLGAFFLANETSSSPVNLIPMIIYGVIGGCLTILIRNIGAYPDGTVYAILVINLINPLIDKIRPKAFGTIRPKNSGKGANNA